MNCILKLLSVSCLFIGLVDISHAQYSSSSSSQCSSSLSPLSGSSASIAVTPNEQGFTVQLYTPGFIPTNYFNLSTLRFLTSGKEIYPYPGSTTKTVGSTLTLSVPYPNFALDKAGESLTVSIQSSYTGSNFSKTVYVTDKTVCKGCKSNGEWVEGTKPVEDPAAEGKEPISWEECDETGVTKKEQENKTKACEELLKQYGLSSSKVCTGGCPTGKECLCDGLYNHNEDGLAFDIICTPHGDPDGGPDDPAKPEGFECKTCRYSAAVTSPDAKPKFKASKCSCHTAAI